MEGEGLAMAEATAYNYRHIVSLLDAAANDLTIFAEDPLFGSCGPLRSFVDGLADGNLRNARTAFTKLNRLVLLGGSECPVRRVSGDLMEDYLLNMVLLSDNAFAVSAAQGKNDEALFLAMRRDLSIISSIRSIKEDAYRFLLSERGREISSRPQSDSTSVLASAAWGGGAVRQMPKDHQSARDSRHFIQDKSSCMWKYGEFELRDSCFADEALEEMYRRFILCDDWGDLTDDLWNFHSAYGCGKFLRFRNFSFDGHLEPLSDLRAGDFIPLADDEYGTLLNNAIAFMRDEEAKPMLLYGAEGMGKTSIMLELTDELPKLRLVLANGNGRKIEKLFGELARQPLKFMVLEDDFDQDEYSHLIEPLIPQNVLFAACSEKQTGASLFRVSVGLKQPVLPEFIRIVETILLSHGVSLGTDVIKSACTDYQVDTGCEFTIDTALKIAELLQS